MTTQEIIDELQKRIDRATYAVDETPDPLLQITLDRLQELAGMPALLVDVLIAAKERGITL